ncbi:hypothetical protein [Campylobacter ureolyticus]|uniref:Ankyrin repeat domain-containing protein n=1 Tax=Campylobacter ureolyticus TaxID=827 RepID=A0A9Q4KL11_9BACT|nr:hypothetical protein [Campylobacter ureolyticus]MCZ6159569.1 hypothetical protein [Campylobacter ureolyticus]MCZ6160877.1 hypothetical protein [Campylobacter ureolyticus]MCZ6163526.1 hypothetical protein [Campylobacter ureolyticus]MCZ6165392.1 hypothetical protein [Campylobacter ureolyticus]MCZ6166865.1 hypothetical protein [Campylobacter ureolyticus]
MKKIVLLIFLALNLNAFTYDELKSWYFEDINCSKFEFKKSSHKFSVDDLNNAIKNVDENKVLEILGSNRSLSFKNDSKGISPLTKNYITTNNILIEDMLFCADERVFKFGIYAAFVINNKNISESKTIEILNQLFNEGLDKNAVFYYEDFGLLNAALAGEKVEVFDYLLDKNCLISDRLGVDLWFNFVSIFMKENLLLSIKKPHSKELINLLNSQKYKMHRTFWLNLTKKVVEKGLNPKNLKSLYKTFEYLGDENATKELLNLGYKNDVK